MNEDFVPFETAKKLKEKGFKEKCYKHYYPDSKDWFLSPSPECGNYSSYLDAPTISQVLKWLREEKNIEVVASFSYRNKVWGYQVGDMTLLEDSILSYDYSFPTYELAALAGIEYCLDNLI